MALNQRRVKILHLISEDGHAKVQDLSKIFNVTDVTIRIWKPWNKWGISKESMEVRF